LFTKAARIPIAAYWKLSANDVEGNYHTQNAQLFAADVARLSGGDLTVDVVPADFTRAEAQRI
jgi:TRAP-type C4-dicarboxylate transport system substrate-binding protein